RREDFAATGLSHPRTEAVAALAHELARLIRPLHCLEITPARRRRAAAYKERAKSSQRAAGSGEVPSKMADVLRPDICVIGGGPGGIAAARTAVQAGAAAVLIEKRTLGGANLAAGAVPLAALMSAASLHAALRRGPTLGVS